MGKQMKWKSKPSNSWSYQQAYGIKEFNIFEWIQDSY